MSEQKPGIDLAAARDTLAGSPARRLDGDWLAVDDVGNLAFFAGNDRGPIPDGADRDRVAEALEALARAHHQEEVARVATEQSDGYRGLGMRASGPVFDVPYSSRGEPMHETPLDGYPLLVIAADPAQVREMAGEWSACEVSARSAFAAVFPVIGRVTYDDLHAAGGCAGCRLLDNPEDPRARAPEVLAAAGIYVYAHVDQRMSAPYRRVAGPTVAVTVANTLPIVRDVASLVRLPVVFESSETLEPAMLVACTQ